jgi:hypothetical protein
VTQEVHTNGTFQFEGVKLAHNSLTPSTRRSVTGGTLFLCGVVIFAFCRMERCVTLSVKEAEFVAADEVVQNMLFAWRILWSMGLTVMLPMLIEIKSRST